MEKLTKREWEEEEFKEYIKEEDKFDTKLINKISKYYYNKKILVIKKFYSKNNLVFLLKFKDKEKVIKIDASKERWKVKKELYLFKILKKHNIPLPKIEFYDTEEKIIPYDWYIMEYIGEKTLNDMYSNKGKTTNKLFFELGKILAKIHKIKFKEQGLIFSDGIEKESFYDSYKRSFDKGIDNLLLFKKISNKEANLTKNIFKNFKDSKQTRLCHDDFGPWQAIVRNNKITGIIDWEWARSSNPSYDLSKTELLMSLWSGNIDVFKKGYRIINHLPNNYESLKKTYKVVELVNLMNYFINDRKNFKKGKDMFIRLIA